LGIIFACLACHSELVSESQELSNVILNLVQNLNQPSYTAFGYKGREQELQKIKNKQNIKYEKNFIIRFNTFCFAGHGFGFGRNKFK